MAHNATAPLLRLRDDKHPRHVFHSEVVATLEAAGCTHFVADQNGQVCVALNNITLDAKHLKAVCDGAARFHRGDGREVGMPESEARLLLGDQRALAQLPHRWAQVLLFLRHASPANRETAEGMHAEYSAWCAGRRETVAVDAQRFSTAVRDTWPRLGG